MPKRIGSIIAMIALAVGVAHAADPAEFKVIVNVANPMESISAKDLSRLFLKKDTEWPDGSTVAAVDLPPDSTIREAFSMTIHGRKVASIKSYWQRQIFAGKNVPPVERANLAEVLVFVALNPRAIGYVGPSTDVIDNVKELKVTD